MGTVEQAMKPKMLTVSLEVENDYADGFSRTVRYAGRRVRAPEPGQDLVEWHDEALFRFTGVGHPGDACYTVRITACSEPMLVGKVFETVG